MANKWRILCMLSVVLSLCACSTGQTPAGNERTQPREVLAEPASDPAAGNIPSTSGEDGCEPELAESMESDQPEIQPANPDAETYVHDIPDAGQSGADSPKQQAAESGTEDSASQEAAEAAGTVSEETGQEEPVLNITFGDYELSATWEDNSSAEEFRELLAQGPLTIEMEDYGGFEKVGSLGTSLTRNDTQITTQPGDVILYQGNQVTIYYGTNSWSFTRLARIDDPSGLLEKLGPGAVSVTFSLE